MTEHDSQPEPGSPDPTDETPTGNPRDPRYTFDRRIVHLRRRLVREATQAIGMLENALDALWSLDVEAAKRVRAEDDLVDREEVAIEEEAYSILALQHAFARDFRLITFVLKVNSDIERVADHAVSIAKCALRIAKQCPPGVVPPWPTALRELGARVPMLCHDLMRSVLDENPEAATALVHADQVIDKLDRRLFDEVVEMVRDDGRHDTGVAIGLLVSRVGRELERVGDLMTNIAEDLVYLATGKIIRHKERKNVAPASPPASPGGDPPHLGS
ncbi:MAG: phosphate signaling complex protein PhoU [Phycisphaeraceae bacterium]|nr:MAG: phosphate signaling complex protein PhoU [Phycisphaeraceae bacterium]